MNEDLALLKDGGEEAIARMNSLSRAQVGVADQRFNLWPAQFAAIKKSMQLSAAFDHAKATLFRQHPFNHLFVLFRFKRTG